MLSAEAVRIRSGLERETVDPAITPEMERRRWDEGVAGEPMEPGTSERFAVFGGVRCSVIEPGTSSDHSTTVVYLHGGGFISGSIVTHRRFASQISRAVESDVIVVDYRLLPENVFPAPVDDVVAVVRALVSSGPDGRHRAVVLAGDSSGASLALSAACVLRDSGDSPVAGMISVSGAFDATLSGDSIDSGLDPQLTRPVLEHWQSLIAESTDFTDPLVSPLLGDLSGLPPLLLLAGEHEAWLSDSVRMADQVERAGGVVRLEVAEGMWHVWPMFGNFREARAALRSMDRFIADLSNLER